MIDRSLAKLILEEPEVQELLKSMILEKHERYEEILELRKKFLSDNNYDDADEFGQWFLERVFDRLIGGEELKQIERDLSGMCFALRRSEGEVPARTKWEDQYDRAVCNTRIEEVIQRYLRVEDFRRNIPCPFHEDKTPSMKVYTDKNRFVCFGCEARGSPIDFVMRYENCDFKEAVLILSNM